MFQLGGKCLAFHGPLLYEAKILKMWDPSTKTVTTWNSDPKDPKEVEKDVIAEEDEIPPEIINFPCYFIHYQGWKSTWDEWIGNTRIREFNNENVELKKKLASDAKEAKKLQEQKEKEKKKKTSTSENNSSTHLHNLSGTNKRKQSDGRSNGILKPYTSSHSRSSRNLSNEQSQGYSTDSSNRKTSPPLPSSSTSQSYQHQVIQQQLHHHNNSFPRITLHIPMKLKSILVDDWESITKEKKIIKLPCNRTVNSILDDYEAEQLSDPENNSLVFQSQLNEYCQGLKLYFNETLPRLLLYRLERLQYDNYLKEHLKETMEVSAVYGSVHLLRLISLLPELISTTTMDPQSCQLIIKQTENLLIWMVLHIDKLAF